ncbi:Transmembrane protease serine 11B-like protein [Orchesella cincta]|uniref:Transmembrane protease serine 11B-like protein n=1 Tax=Orchesella cincta TaxID=48709 RepID=A0A1D2MHL9_ORCCI|nr:Transmembrane protease serine 11B-like protein [Orchesella cincta]
MKWSCLSLDILVVFAALLACSNSLKWVVDDAVYITAPIETRSPDDSPSNGSSATVDREPGRCRKFRDCYPIFFLSDRADQEPTSINSGLTDFILETSDVCEPLNPVAAVNETSNIDKGDIYIWCPLRTISDKTPGKRKPAIIGSKAESEDVCTSLKFHDDHSTTDGTGLRVVGGKPLPAGEAPYMAVMTFRGKQVCGASLIDESHVLTAAHCVSHLKPSVLPYLRILIGDHDISDPMDVQHQERNVSKVMYHKEFSVETLHDDVAMIKVSEPVNFGSSVSPVCLSEGIPPFDDGSTVGTLVGWGQLSATGVRPFTPRIADLRIWKQEDCEEAYEGIAPEEVLEKTFCAGGFQDGGTTDACKGDSGGPFTIVRNNRVEQVGIVSFGVGCGRLPGVFTRTSEYEGWIEKHRSFIFDFE